MTGLPHLAKQTPDHFTEEKLGSFPSVNLHPCWRNTIKLHLVGQSTKKDRQIREIGKMTGSKRIFLFIERPMPVCVELASYKVIPFCLLCLISPCLVQLFHNSQWQSIEFPLCAQTQSNHWHLCLVIFALKALEVAKNQTKKTKKKQSTSAKRFITHQYAEVCYDWNYGGQNMSPWKEGQKMLPVHCRTQRGFNTWHNVMFKFGNNTRKRRFHPNLPKFKGPNLVCYESTRQLMPSKAFCLVMRIVKPASKPVFSTLRKLKGRRCVPVHIRSSLLQHGLFS